jgi:hypothetical protein
LRKIFVQPIGHVAFGAGTEPKANAEDRRNDGNGARPASGRDTKNFIGSNAHHIGDRLLREYYAPSPNKSSLIGLPPAG